MGGPQRVRSLGGASCASTRLARIIPPAPPSLARCQDRIIDGLHVMCWANFLGCAPLSVPSASSAGSLLCRPRHPNGALAPARPRHPLGHAPPTPGCRPGAARPLRRPPQPIPNRSPGAALTFCPALRAAEEGRCRCGGGRGGDHSEPDRRPRGRDRRKFCAPAPPGPCGHKSR